MISNSAFFFILKQQKNKTLFNTNYLYLLYIFLAFGRKKTIDFLEGRLLNDVQLLVQM